MDSEVKDIAGVQTRDQFREIEDAQGAKGRTLRGIGRTGRLTHCAACVLTGEFFDRPSHIVFRLCRVSPLNDGTFSFISVQFL